RVSHRPAERSLGAPLELAQDRGGDRLGSESATIDLVPVVAAHLPLDGADRALRVEQLEVAGFAAHAEATATVHVHHRGDDGISSYRYRERPTLREIRDDRVGGSEIDADLRFGHGLAHAFLLATI